MRKIVSSSAAIGIAAAAVFGLAPAANASKLDDDRGEVTYACWGSMDTGDSVCATDDATLKAKVLKQYGILLADDSREAAALRSQLAASPQFRSDGVTPLAVGDPAVTLSDGATYGGSYLTLTTVNSGCGVNGAVLGDYIRGIWPLTWDNAVSSYKSKRAGCSYTIYDGNYWTGDHFGPSAAASGVGSMNNRASSVKSG